MVALDYAADGPRLKSGESCENEKPCLLEASRVRRKIDDLCQIVNYLLTSLVRFAFLELGWVIVNWAPKQPPTRPIPKDIPEQRSPEGACA